MAEPLRLPAQAYIYVIGDKSGPQKSGMAADPKRRLALFQTGNVSNLVLATAVSIPRHLAREAERYAHWMLRDARSRGEWFSITPDEASKIVDLAVAKILAGERAPIGAALHSDVMTIRFEAGDFARIDALAGKNRRAKFIRESVEAELKRRERAAKPKKQD